MRSLHFGELEFQQPPLCVISDSYMQVSVAQHLLSVKFNKFCLVLAQPSSNLWPQEHGRHVSVLILVLLSFLHCPVAQIPDTSLSLNSDLCILSLVLSLLPPWAHLACVMVQEILPGRKKKDTLYFSPCKRSQYCTTCYSKPQTMNSYVFFCFVLLWQEVRSGTNYSILVRNRYLNFRLFKRLCSSS